MVQQTERDGDNGELGKAVHDLEQAERRLANARVEEAAAEHDIAHAVEEIEDAEHGPAELDCPDKPGQPVRSAAHVPGFAKFGEKPGDVNLGIGERLRQWPAAHLDALVMPPRVRRVPGDNAGDLGLKRKSPMPVG